jgi:hypothetical protein
MIKMLLASIIQFGLSFNCYEVYLFRLSFALGRMFVSI